MELDLGWRLLASLNGEGWILRNKKENVDQPQKCGRGGHQARP